MARYIHGSTFGWFTSSAKSLVRTLTTTAYPPIIHQHTALGPIQGVRSGSALTVHFFNIPYAKPLADHTSLVPPEQPEKWTDALDCTDSDLHTNMLHLNVTAPLPPPPKNIERNISGSESYYQRNHHTRTLLPVVLQIPDEAQHDQEKDTMTSPTDQDQEVIRVSIHHRLVTPGTPITNELAVKDLQMGLDWVQTNIMQFGGDPNDVTFNGDSVEVLNVAALLAPRIADM